MFRQDDAKVECQGHDEATKVTTNEGTTPIQRRLLVDIDTIHQNNISRISPDSSQPSDLVQRNSTYMASMNSYPSYHRGCAFRRYPSGFPARLSQSTMNRLSVHPRLFFRTN